MKLGLLIAVAAVSMIAACGGNDDQPRRGQSRRPTASTEARRVAPARSEARRTVQVAPAVTPEQIREKKEQVRGDIRGLMAQIDGELNR